MRNFKCSNCAQSLRAVTLTAHYGRTVEVDVCDGCCLIWFDEVESVRIAKPGIAELVKIVHGAMSQGERHGGAASLAAAQHCPVCAARLRQVFRKSGADILPCLRRPGRPDPACQLRAMPCGPAAGYPVRA